MAPSGDHSAAALTAQLDSVWAALASLGRSLTDGEWSAPTACPGWPVSAHYAHVIGTESMLLGRPNPEVDAGAPGHVRNPIGGFNEVWVAALAGEPRAEVLDLLAEVTAARRAALAAMTDADFEAPSWTPAGQATYGRFMQIRVFDCWVHLQDIRHAVGRPGDESGPVAEQSLDEIVRALGYIVGKKAGAPAGASVRFDLSGPMARRVDVAVVDGRARVVDSLDGEPTVTLTADAAVLARVACGRVPPAAAPVGVTGDADLGQRVLANLAFTI